MRSKKQQEVNGLTWKKKAFSIVLFLIAAILTARIFMVNLQWPAASRIEIPTGEKFSLDGLALSVESSSIMSPEEIYSFCKMDKEQATRLMLEQMIAQGWQAKILCITLSAANETDHPVAFHTGNLMAECGPWSNGLDFDLFEMVNHSTGTVEIAPSESKEIHLFYDLYDQHFTPYDWKNIDNQPFALTISLYPEKILLCV